MTRTPFPRLGAHALSWSTATAVALVAPAAGQTEGEDPTCWTAMETSAAGPISPVVMMLGEDVMYDETGVLVPEPIPLYVVPGDGDELRIRCGNQCVPIDIAGRVATTWMNVGAENGMDAGVFLDAHGEVIPTAPGSDAVLWLPPRDFDPGESRVIRLEARLKDEEAGGTSTPADADTVITFRADVVRSPAPDSFFTITVQFEDIEVPDPEPPCVLGGSGCCTFVGGGPQVGDQIEVSFAEEDYPSRGMITHEYRTVRVTAWDLDESAWECGEPPCPSTFPSSPPPFHDKLNFTWELVQGSGIVEIVHENPNSPMIVLKSLEDAGTVELRVTASNPGGGWSFPDPPKDATIEFQVYELDWIEQANTKLQRILLTADGDYDTTKDDVGLSVSTDHLVSPQLTGCNGGSDAELFAGQHTGDPDPNTYRVEIDARGANENDEYRVALRTRRAVLQPSGQWGEEEPYAEEFDTVGQGDVHRLRKDFRLVSNAELGHEPAWTYDDEVCAEQTVHVELGDWVEAELQVKEEGEQEFERVASMELPVERPWSEAALGWDDFGPRPILTFPIRVMHSHTSTTFGNRTDVDPNGSWIDAGERMADQCAEDFAQAGLRCSLAAHHEAPPLVNTVFVYQPSPQAPVQAGDLELELHWNGVHPLTIPVDDDAGDYEVAQAVVDAIVPIVDPDGDGDPIVDHWDCKGRIGDPTVPEGRIVFVARGSQDVRVDVIATPTNLQVERFVPGYATPPFGTISATAIATLAGNHRRDIENAHGPTMDDDEIEVLVMKADNLWIWDGQTVASLAGATWHTLTPGNDVRWHTLAVVEDAGRGSDALWSVILGHEVGHYLMRQSRHSQTTTNLMHGSQGTGEAPDGPKRLVPDHAQPYGDQIEGSRTGVGVRETEVRIPEKRR